MHIRTIFKIISLGIFALLLGACDNKPNTTDTPQQTATQQQKIVVGTSASYIPWAYQQNDEVKGFEIDVWKEIVKRNNYDLQIRLGQFSGLVGMLDVGEIDTIAHQMSITPEREKKYYFSSPYAYSYYDFFVKNGSPFKTKEDLKGKRVGCWLGQNGEATLRAINKEHDLQLDIVAFDGTSIENEVVIGRIDAVWQGEIKTKTVISDNQLPLHQLNEKLTFEINAYPFRQTERGKQLSEEVTKTLDAMRADGTLAKLSNKWFNVDTTNNTSSNNGL